MKNQSGQVIIILILIMLVTLTVVLAVSQRSLTSIQVSTKTEQTTRAFSAAEAGIEIALQSNLYNYPTTTHDLGNGARTTVRSSGALPINDTTGIGIHQAMEYPPINKAEFAQVWLADPETLIPTFKANTFKIYFGNATGNPVNGEPAYDGTDPNPPALEVNLITQNRTTNVFTSHREYFDSSSLSVGTRDNGFIKNDSGQCRAAGFYTLYTVLSKDMTSAPNRTFQCEFTFPTIPVATEIPILVRMRLLYSNTRHRVALDPGNCGANCALPPQAVIYTSTGYAGETQRTVQAFQVKNVAPHLLDFVIFSAGDLSKD